MIGESYGNILCNKNVTGNYHFDNSSEDSEGDEGDVCSSEDEVLVAGPWSEGDEEETTL